MEQSISQNEKEMNSNNIKDYYVLLSKMIELYEVIQPILLINLNDLFKEKNILLLKNNALIKDTITILKQNNFNFNALLQNEISPLENNKDNLYIKLSNTLKELLRDKCIESNGATEEKMVILTKNRKNLFKKKKDHEVRQLSNFIHGIFSKTKLETMLEMGCGKSYLTESLLKDNPNCLYIGIDMKEKLIEKSQQINSNQNVIVLSGIVTANNFDEFYLQNIKQHIKEHKKAEKNIFLFGLHSCGNLTSDTLRLFANHEFFSHLAIVSCCMNLLTEYVTPTAQQTELFKDYAANVGVNNKGEKLEQTLVYTEEEAKTAGYPLSNFMITQYPKMFLSRTIRNSAMQKNTETGEINSLQYKKILYRTYLQVFFEHYIPELALTYGFGKVDLNNEDTFKDYLFNILDVIKKDKDEAFHKKVDEIKSNADSILKEFLSKYEKEEIINLLWGANMIRMKFSKLIEYIIALDRIIYLFENKIYNVRLIKTFNECLSTRNILIYADKKYHPKESKGNEREVLSLFNNESDNIIKYYKENDKLDKDGKVIIFLEKCDENLFDIKQKMNLIGEVIPEKIVVHIIKEIFKGIVFMNTKGFSHNHISLENIQVKYESFHSMNIKKLSALSEEEKKEYIEELTESMLSAQYIISNCEMASKYNDDNKSNDIINIGKVMYSLLTKDSNLKDIIIREETHISLKNLLIINCLLKNNISLDKLTQIIDKFKPELTIQFNKMNPSLIQKDDKGLYIRLPITTEIFNKGTEERKEEDTFNTLLK